jgi:hypothetical protein
MCVSQGSFEDYSKTSEPIKEPMLLQRLNLKKNWTGDTCQRQRFNTTLLKDIGKQKNRASPSQTGSRFCKSFWERRPLKNYGKR